MVATKLRVIAAFQVLVFCTMTQALDMLEEHLEWRGFCYERLDGATPAAERGAIVDRFNSPGNRSLVCKLVYICSPRRLRSIW